MKEKGLKFKDKTKMVYAVFSVFVFVLLVATSFSGALTRTITDSSDNIKTFITNSNGNYWEVTGANIQLAIDDLGTEGGVVYIPSENISIANITFDSTDDGITLQGCGVGTGYGTGWNEGYGRTTTLWVDSEQPDGVIQLNGVHTSGWVRHITIKDLVIATLPSRNVVGINGTAVQGCDIINVNFVNLRTALWIDEFHGLRVFRSSFWNCGNKTHETPVVYFTASRNKVTHPEISHCFFESCNYKWITVNTTSSPDGGGIVPNAIIMNNYFEDSQGETGNIETGIEPGNYWNIKNNYFLGNVNHSFINLSSYQTIGAKIIDNSFSMGAFANAENRDAQIYVNDGDFITIRGNRFTNSDRASIWFMVNTNNNSVIDNKISNASTIGINCAGDDMVLSGNHIYNCDPDLDYGGMGINIISGSRNVVVTKNIINNCEYGIRAIAGSVNVTIKNNQLIGLTRDVITLGGTNIVIKDNVGYKHNSLTPFYEQNTAPTITDNCTAYWYDLDDDYLYQITNSYGSVWYVNMSKTI